MYVYFAWRSLTNLRSSPPQVIPTANAVSLEDDGDYARFENRGDEELDFMLIEAEPTRESVVARVRGWETREEPLVGKLLSSLPCLSPSFKGGVSSSPREEHDVDYAYM